MERADSDIDITAKTLRVLSDSHPVILFDGVCNLCNGVVNFLIDRDADARLRFGALQSSEAAEILAGLDFDTTDVDSILLVHQGKVRVRSDAALGIARELGGIWHLARIFLIVPRPVRDLVYNWVARSRYKWFGRRDECRIPTAELRLRFIDGLR